MPEFLRDNSLLTSAREKGRDLSPARVLLMFLAVFIAASLLESIFAVIIMLLSDGRAVFEHMKSEGAYSDEFLEWLKGRDSYVVSSLFARIADIAAVLIFCLVIEKRSSASLGLIKKGAVRSALLGYFAGFAMLTSVMAIVTVTGAARITGVSSQIRWGYIILLFFGFVIQSTAEELLFRSYLTVSLAKKTGAVPAAVISSLLFASAHIANTDRVNVIALINIFLYGMFASFLMFRTGNIFVCSTLHAAWNFTQGCIWGTAVSGISAGASVFSCYIPEEFSVTSGGEFGLEGGLAATAVFIIGIAAVMYFSLKKRPEHSDG